MTGVAWTLRVFESACCTRIVSELAQLGGVQSSRNRVEEGIESGTVGDLLRGESTNVGRRQIAEADTLDLGCDGS